MLNKGLVIRLLQRLACETAYHEELPAGRLSAREREVLQLLTQGQTNREIARNLTVSVSTVKIHVEHILAKLGVSDRTHVAVHAIALGILHTPSLEWSVLVCSPTPLRHGFTLPSAAMRRGRNTAHAF